MSDITHRGTVLRMELKIDPFVEKTEMPRQARGTSKTSRWTPTMRPSTSTRNSFLHGPHLPARVGGALAGFH